MEAKNAVKIAEALKIDKALLFDDFNIRELHTLGRGVSKGFWNKGGLSHDT